MVRTIKGTNSLETIWTMSVVCTWPYRKCQSSVKSLKISRPLLITSVI